MTIPSRFLRLFLTLLICLGILLSACKTRATPTPLVSLPDTPTSTAKAAIPTLSVSTAPPATGGLLMLAMLENGTSHLFAFSPVSLTLTRLTADAWDDISPSISPDGKQVAFSSRRNGYWDLYLLDLVTGSTTRLTDTPGYEALPSWSPDGQWLVYTSNMDGNLDLYIRSVTNPSQAPIRLTTNPAADHSPAWSPGARQVAFISNRTGQDDIWLADLNQAGDDNYTNLSNTPHSSEAHPAWSPDGNLLAWGATDADGLSTIQVYDLRTPQNPPRQAGTGNWPVWQDNGHLVAVTEAPNQWYLSGFNFPGGDMSLGLSPLPGTLRGLTWIPAGLPSPLAPAFQAAAAWKAETLFTPASPERTGIPGGRAALVTLEDIQAPYPEMHDAAVSSFLALKQHVAAVVGWDALASLANAYVPLTTPLDPGMEQDWLYTGRAFSLNPVLANAGWIAAVREDMGGETYWRLFLRTLAQDGSQGEPLTRAPWDFNARYGGDPALYDQGGGTVETIPSGYWFDLTAMAAEYGWQRLPALSNWRTYSAGARFGEFAFTQGLDWYTAMLELYPAEALVTPTIVIPPTRTPTRTPSWYRTPTPSRIPTARPTLTPSP